MKKKTLVIITSVTVALYLLLFFYSKLRLAGGAVPIEGKNGAEMDIFEQVLMYPLFAGIITTVLSTISHAWRYGSFVWVPLSFFILPAFFYVYACYDDGEENEVFKGITKRVNKTIKEEAEN